MPNIKSSTDLRNNYNEISSLEAVTDLSWGRVAPVVADPSVVLPACFASCAF